MSDVDADLREYYEAEARLRSRRPLRGRRRQLRDDFVDLLAEEGRRSVLDLGAGPGRDGEAFAAAGLRFVGVDLAHGNGRLAAEAGLVVVQGSAMAVPIRPSSIEAGWSMSTLMHLDDADAARATEELVAALRPGSPATIGVWGREVEGLVIDGDGVPGRRRPFWIRSLDHNRSLVGAVAAIEEEWRWEAVSEDWDYHIFRVRTPG